MPHRPLVAIVGRPNVGKSTLFNRIVGSRKAAVHETPGMTRDRHYSDAIYRMRPFTVIDTGGYEDSTDSTLLQQMRTQVMVAIDEADRVIFLADMNEPDDPADQEIIERLRLAGKPFFLVVNKSEEKMAHAQAIADFSRYGLDEVHPVSALHGEGLMDMLDAVTEGFDEWDPDEVENDKDRRTRVAIVGRQNVGKSTLLNKLFGSERVIANPLGGTTRDAIDADVNAYGKEYTLIDTAGIRRRGRIEKGPEKISVHSSFRAIERSDVVLLVLDAAEGITQQDMHIAGYVLERHKACVLVLNKWDLVQDREQAFGRRIREVREQFNFMPWAPILTISAATGQRTQKIWDLVERCAMNFRREFPTSDLNLVLKKAKAFLSPPTRRGKTLTMKYVTQTDSNPPTFTIFVNDPLLLHFSYKRFLTNQFYAQLGLEGTPLLLKFRRKAPPRGWERHGDTTGSEKDLIREARRYYGRVYNDQGEPMSVGIDLESMEEMNEQDFERYYIIGGDDDEDGGGNDAED